VKVIQVLEKSSALVESRSSTEKYCLRRKNMVKQMRRQTQIPGGKTTPTAADDFIKMGSMQLELSENSYRPP